MNRLLLKFLLIGLSAIASTTANQVNANSSESTVSNSQATAGFNSGLYLLDNPDADKQVRAGEFKSALEHYEKVGKTGKNSTGGYYESTFTGTNGSDTVQGLGQASHTHFIGVELAIESDKGGDYPVNFTSLGEGEIDTLIGNEGGGNEFLLGTYVTSAHPEARTLYVGQGDKDYAKVQNFTPGKDSVWLSGVPEQYKIESAEVNVRISTKEGDLVAIIEGIEELKLGKISEEYGQFELK
jgi:hypothetical protein